MTTTREPCPKVLLGEMSAFRLRQQQIYIERAELYESSHPEAPVEGWIRDDLLTVRGVILTKRTPQASTQSPYAYLDTDLDSARGIWLNKAWYRLVGNNQSDSVERV